MGTFNIATAIYNETKIIETLEREIRFWYELPDLVQNAWVETVIQNFQTNGRFFISPWHRKNSNNGCYLGAGDYRDTPLDENPEIQQLLAEIKDRYNQIEKYLK